MSQQFNFETWPKNKLKTITKFWCEVWKRFELRVYFARHWVQTAGNANLCIVRKLWADTEVLKKERCWKRGIYRQKNNEGDRAEKLSLHLSILIFNKLLHFSRTAYVMGWKPIWELNQNLLGSHLNLKWILFVTMTT